MSEITDTEIDDMFFWKWKVSLSLSKWLRSTLCSAGFGYCFVCHFLCTHVSASADGDRVRGTAVADFIAASISHCLETAQASAIYFWWTSKRKVERQKKGPNFRF